MAVAETAAPPASAPAPERSSSATRDRLRHWALGIWSALALLYLFIPVFIVVLSTFNDNKGRFNFTWEGFRLCNSPHPFADPDLTRAVLDSIDIAAISTAI